MAILTDGHGRPFPEVDVPAADTPIEAKIAYLRAVAARNNAIATCANRAFDGAFRKAPKARGR